MRQCELLPHVLSDAPSEFRGQCGGEGEGACGRAILEDFFKVAVERAILEDFLKLPTLPLRQTSPLLFQQRT